MPQDSLSFAHLPLSADLKPDLTLHLHGISICYIYCMCSALQISPYKVTGYALKFLSYFPYAILLIINVVAVT